MKMSEEYFILGEAYFEKELYQPAIFNLTKSIEINEDDASTFLLRAACFEQTGDLTAALSDYEKAIEIDESLTEAYLDKARIYRLTGQYKNALKTYDLVLNEVDSLNFEAWKERGTTQISRYKDPEALEDLNRACSIKNDDPELLLTRALLLRRLEDSVGCCTDLQQAAQLGNPTAADYIDVFCK